MNQPKQIVIIGAGYAGMLATMRLAGKLDNEIKRGTVALTLVNAADLFVERLRLHQLAAGQPLRQQRIRDILGKRRVTFVQGIVTAIDASHHALDVNSAQGAQRLSYNILVYALGSLIDRDRIPGVREHAYVLNPSGANGVSDLHVRLSDLSNYPARLSVIGGGATGIEAAAEFAESYPQLKVQLITQGAFGAFLNQRAADQMRASLERLGVEITDGTTIAQVTSTTAITSTGARLAHDLCVWAGGFTVPSLARDAGLPVNAQGQILIDPFMRSLSHPHIFAIGDAATPVATRGAAVRMSAFTAVILGAHGADCVTAQVLGKPPQPLKFNYYGQGIALGRHDALGFGLTPYDVPKGPYLTGRLAVEGREFFVRLLADLPNLERRLPGFLPVMGNGVIALDKHGTTPPARRETGNPNAQAEPQV